MRTRRHRPLSKVLHQAVNYSREHRVRKEPIFEVFRGFVEFGAFHEHVAKFGSLVFTPGESHVGKAGVVGFLQTFRIRTGEVVVESQRFRDDTVALLVIPLVVQSVDGFVSFVVLYSVRVGNALGALEHKQALSGLVLLLLVNRELSSRVGFDAQLVYRPHGVSSASKVGTEEHDNGFVVGLGFREEVVERGAPESVEDKVRGKVVWEVRDEFVDVDDADPKRKSKELET